MAASQEELRLGEQRETWCAVERMKEEAWCRKERGHIQRYQDEMDSDVFHRTGCNKVIEERCTFAPDKPMHRQQRHFPRIDNKSQLNL
ncbi:hypothetical protein PoB_005441600 [Plakobranchus ocellatus]|uniref:Uncharacterized protein n=1 Tax=Plakobranchus ocellatus TaxID=259542 RepID=A0AAV4BXN8_9GAST|nr:hypothetical protein PoB_005441600 [Plakobranchus ocellatus]